VGTRHTCGIQNVNPQGPNVVVVGQGGARGVQGAQGMQGAQGIQGATGTGIQGAQGIAGKSVSILGSYSSQAELVAAHPTGNSGDAYLVSGLLYVWNGSAWENVGSISGAQGIQGATGSGAQGAQGIQGAAGVQGAGGTQGIQGAVGPVGAQGIQGAGGIQGATGVQGAAGIQGANGSQGAQGIQGANGTQGTQGLQGTTGTGTQGAQGAQGIQGLQGGGISAQQLADAIAGISLASTDDLPEGTVNKYFTTSRVSYVHTQSVAASTWVVNHNLGFYPNVTVRDSGGTIYEGEISYTTLDSLTLTFSNQFAGNAYLS